MKLYGAIDLHCSNNVLVLIDERDRVHYVILRNLKESAPFN